MIIFGVPLERLREIGTRHVASQGVAEAMALLPLGSDNTISPLEMTAFMKFRGASAMLSAYAAADDPIISMVDDVRALAAELGL